MALGSFDVISSLCLYLCQLYSMSLWQMANIINHFWSNKRYHLYACRTSRAVTSGTSDTAWWHCVQCLSKHLPSSFQKGLGSLANRSLSLFTRAVRWSIWLSSQDLCFRNNWFIGDIWCSLANYFMSGQNRQIDMSSNSVRENHSTSENSAGESAPLDTGVQYICSVACCRLFTKVNWSINQSTHLIYSTA